MSSRNRVLGPGTLIAIIACASSSPQSQTSGAPSRERATESNAQSKLAGTERRDGFIPVLLDVKQGKIYLEIPRDSARALMFVSLASGLGSNPIGLDRGANGVDSDCGISFEFP